jgi:hypothetical protein
MGLNNARAGNVVVDWNNEFLTITQQTSGNVVAGPPEVAREIAQLGAAMSDAVNAATGSTISSFAYTGGPVANADANVAAATAAYTALINIFTDPVWSTPVSQLTNNPVFSANTSNTTLANNVILPELRNFFSSELSSLGLTSPGACATSASALCNGYNLGIAAAAAVNTSATFSPVASGAVASIVNGLNANMPAGSGTAGVYVPPSNPARPEMFPTWGGTTPTGATSAQVTAAESAVTAPVIGSASYANNLLQTECQGYSGGQSALPANIQAACAAAGFAQTTAQQITYATSALFWNDPGTTIQPPGHWLQIADSAMTGQNTSLLQSAELTALLGEAQNSAGIAAWDLKYQYNLWRPTTAINSCTGTASWNSNFTTCDQGWSSLIATPPHPDYVAGHPAFSGAAATVLANFFGTDNVSFSSTSNYYCNGGTNIFDSNNMVIGCKASNGTTYTICPSGQTPDFVNGLPVDCTDGTNTYAVTGDNCNTVTSTGVNNGSLLICPITESYTSFSAASQGPLGSEYSRVVGGIHTPAAVQDALTVGVAIGLAVSGNAGLPDVVPEPSSLSLCAVGLLALIRFRRRFSANGAAVSAA